MNLSEEEADEPLELDAAYEAEIERRLAEIDGGRAKMYSLDEVMAGLRKPQHWQRYGHEFRG